MPTATDPTAHPGTDPAAAAEPATPAQRHIVVITRWHEKYALYENYLDHRRDAVSYVTTPVGVDSIPAAATAVEVVGHTDDLPAVRQAVRRLVAGRPDPTHIVGLKEDDLLVAADLRAEWGCPGWRREQLMLFRDKALMVQAVAAAGVPTPRWQVVSGPAEVLDFAAEVGWPVVLKPRRGSSSEGVELLDGPAELAGRPWTDSMLVQSYNPHQIVHVDGLFSGEHLGPWTASRYVNDCLGFRHGDLLGSVEIDDPAALDLIETTATAALAALTSAATVFHLELFLDVEGGRCWFLEVGARVGGSEIPFLWRDLHGYDLMEAAFRLQLGEAPPSTAGFRPHVEHGGWLLAPAPAERPCRITDVSLDIDGADAPYAQVVLERDQILPDADAYYEHVGGRFRFRAATSAEVERRLQVTAGTFKVEGEQIGADEL